MSRPFALHPSVCHAPPQLWRSVPISPYSLRHTLAARRFRCSSPLHGNSALGAASDPFTASAWCGVCYRRAVTMPADRPPRPNTGRLNRARVRPPNSSNNYLVTSSRSADISRLSTRFPDVRTRRHVTERSESAQKKSELIVTATTSVAARQLQQPLIS